MDVASESGYLEELSTAICSQKLKSWSVCVKAMCCNVEIF